MSATKDQIISLPGSPEFSSKQYSGFLSISATKNIHYYYVESENDPATDSIVFWTNGGPGCSGLLGLFTEFGPWRPQFDGTLARNPASWTSLASVVFLEQPAGVGYSTTTDPNELASNDFKAARDNVLVIKEFFKRFPERVGNTMYLASESYGGHYVPQLTLSLLADRELSKHFEGFLVGNPYTSYASGDIANVNTLWGLQLIDYPSWSKFTSNKCNLLDLTAYNLPDICINTLSSILSETESLNPYALNFPVCKGDFVGHKEENKLHRVWSNSAQARTLGKLYTTLGTHRETVKTAEKMKIKKNGEAVSDKDPGYDMEFKNEKNDRLDKISSFPGHRRNTDTDTNTNTNTYTYSGKSEKIDIYTKIPSKEKRNLENTTMADYHENSRTFRTGDIHNVWQAQAISQIGLEYNPCSESYTVAYLNDPAVQYALHIIPDPSSPAVPWTVCSDPIFTRWSLTDMYADTTKLFSEIYQKVTTQKLNGERVNDFRMLVYSGDVDGICATVGTQHWIYSVTASTEHSSSASSSSPSLLSAESVRQSMSKGTTEVTNKKISSKEELKSTSTSVQRSLKSVVSLWQPWVLVNNDPNVDILTGQVNGRQQGGFLTKFDGSFSFATVHGAGHEVPTFQPVAALSLFSGFLDGSIFTPSTSSSMGTTVRNKNDIQTQNILIGVIIVIFGAFGLGAVCILLYSRERKLRRGSSGPPVSTIELETDAEEDEGRAGPGTLTLRVTPIPTSRPMSSPNNKYIPMATEEETQ